MVVVLGYDPSQGSNLEREDYKTSLSPRLTTVKASADKSIILCLSADSNRTVSSLLLVAALRIALRFTANQAAFFLLEDTAVWNPLQELNPYLLVRS